MKIILASLSLLIGTQTLASADEFKLSCVATNTLESEPQTASLVGPLMNHDFRLRVFDINNNQVSTGRCVIESLNQARCFSKDQYGQDDEVVLTVSFINAKINDVDDIPAKFSMVTDDNSSDFSVVWNCSAVK